MGKEEQGKKGITKGPPAAAQGRPGGNHRWGKSVNHHVLLCLLQVATKLVMVSLVPVGGRSPLLYLWLVRAAVARALGRTLALGRSRGSGFIRGHASLPRWGTIPLNMPLPSGLELLCLLVVGDFRLLHLVFDGVLLGGCCSPWKIELHMASVSVCHPIERDGQQA